MSGTRRVFVAEDGAVPPLPHAVQAGADSPAARIRALRRATLGEDLLYPTPLGFRRATYCDHTATGRANALVEAAVTRLVLPTLANTHTSTSYTGWCSHNFLEESRGIVRDSVAGASDALHAVILAGRGATGASNALLHMLLPSAQRQRQQQQQQQQDKHTCAFPGCGRVYGSALELLTHARTHPDGEGVAWRGHSAATAVAAAGGAAAPGSAPAPLPAAVEVVVGPFAHHSSFLPWHAAGARMTHVSSLCSTSSSGSETCAAAPQELLRALDAALAAAASRGPALLVALLTVASNVTGATLPQDAATALVHAHGGLALWDAAAAAPHGIGLCMVEAEGRAAWDAGDLTAALGRAPMAAAGGGTGGAGGSSWSALKDALYFSPHKLLGGGAGCTGVLVVRRGCIRSTTPCSPGGGTVFFVTPAGEPRYLGNDSEREEAGSPDVAAAARTGLCLLFARRVGWEEIRRREAALAAVAAAAWAAHPRIKVLGRTTTTAPPPVPILSLSIASKQGGLLHWGLVCAMLTDVFGLQVRGGCLCAGPYASEVLGLSLPQALAIEERLLVARDELLRPGVVRLSFSYTTTHAALRYAIAAVLWVADHGDALAPWYTALPETGEWRAHRAGLHSAMEEGYRQWSRSGSSSSSTPRALISAMVDAGVGGSVQGLAESLELAHKGGIKAHTRTWLQSVRFGAGSSEGVGVGEEEVERVLHTPPSPSIKWEGGFSAQQEAALYAAYLEEAAVLLLGISTAQPAQRLEQQALLLSPAGAQLRWFSLPGQEAPPPLDLVGRQAGLLHSQACAALQDPALGGYAEVLGKEAVTAQELSVWEGVEEGSGGSGSAVSASGAQVGVSRVQQAVGGVQGGRASGSGVKKATRTRHEDGTRKDSSPSGSGGSSGAAAAAAAAAASGSGGMKSLWLSSTLAGAALPVASCSGAGAPPPPTLGPILPSQYALRKAKLAFTQGALARVLGQPGPPPALCRTLSSAISEAVVRYRMIGSGDRVLVGLSGGKDSMTLLLQLLRLQAVAPVWFEVGACTVDPQYEGFNPAPLKAWCASLGVPYFFEAVPIMELAKEHMDKDSICAFCSRLKRGILYSAARREGYNVLALGQHLDDLAESFVMSAFRNGLLRTMKAHYLNDDGDIRIIRPLALCRERSTREYAHAAALPVIAENCPACFSGPTVRYKVKKMLAKEEGENGNLFQVLAKAMRPLMTSAGHAAVAGAGGGEVGLDVLRAAPAGFVPAQLGEGGGQGGGEGAGADAAQGGEGEEEAGEAQEAFLPLCGADEDF